MSLYPWANIKELIFDHFLKTLFSFTFDFIFYLCLQNIFIQKIERLPYLQESISCKKNHYFENVTLPALTQATFPY